MQELIKHFRNIREVSQEDLNGAGAKITTQKHTRHLRCVLNAKGVRAIQGLNGAHIKYKLERKGSKIHLRRNGASSAQMVQINTNKVFDNLEVNTDNLYTLKFKDKDAYFDLNEFKKTPLTK